MVPTSSNLRRDLILNGFQSTGWMLFCGTAVLVAAGLIVLLMRYERRLVSRPVGVALLGLRLSVLGVLLLTLLEPVLTWTLDRDRTGRIVVALDLSESMGTADAHASKAEKLRWARGLGMIGNEQIDDRLDRWQQAFEEGREPDWVDAHETDDPDRRAQLADVRRENLEGIFQEIDGLTRKEIALRLLTSTASPLLPQLRDFGNVEVVVFAGHAETADAESLAKTLESPPEAVLAGVSDLTAGLSAAPHEQGNSPLIGIVLFTDGRDTSGRDAVGLASRLGNTEVPVYPVVLGSELRPKDLAIASLDYPPSAFKDDKPLLKAVLNTSGFEDEEIPVILERDGAEPVTKTVRTAGATTPVEFELDASDVGRHEYTIRTDVRPGETRDDNNAKAFALTIVDDEVDVLLLEGEARWEFRFLHNAFARDTRAEIESIVYTQPYLGVLDDTYWPRTLTLPADPDDMQSSPFAEPDLVILGDLDPVDLPEAGWQFLEKFVAESGGTLVLTAGKRHFPLAYRSPTVDKLVPLTNLRPLQVDGRDGTGSPTERGFHLKLTLDGENEPMLQFDTDPVANRAIWSGLPGHLWGLLGEAKPGATVLATAVLPNRPNTLEAERQSAVIVRQPYGFGQVLWIGIDSTWRWRHRVGDTYHHRFWGQIARWAADNKAAAGNEFVRFGPERGEIEVGEDVVLRARWTQPFLRRHPNLVVKAELFRLGDAPPPRPFSTIELAPVDTRPLVHEARLVSLPAGQYRIRLVVENGDLGPGPIETTLNVNEKTTPELADLSANRPLLTQIADASRGRVFTPDEVRQLPEHIRKPELLLSERHEIELWDHWIVMLVFFSLLTTEWVVRKLNGLP